MNIEELAYDEAIRQGSTGVHPCCEWDGLIIWDGCPEMKFCTCDLTELRKAEAHE